MRIIRLFAQPQQEPRADRTVESLGRLVRVRFLPPRTPGSFTQLHLGCRILDSILRMTQGERKTIVRQAMLGPTAWPGDQRKQLGHLCAPEAWLTDCLRTCQRTLLKSSMMIARVVRV
jgi:hypothetical protein